MLRLVEVKLVLVWGRPHKVEEDPTTGWRGSQAGRGTLSRRRAAPEQPERGEGLYVQVKKSATDQNNIAKVWSEYCQNILSAPVRLIYSIYCQYNILEYIAAVFPDQTIYFDNTFYIYLYKIHLYFIYI